MHQQSWTFSHLWALLLWAVILPEASADQTTTKSARASRPGPDQEIVDIVPVQHAPPDARNIHHHRHHERLPRESPSSNFPTAFDTSLSNNFTSNSCPDYFAKFLSDSTFTDCHAISTLLRDSTGFFHTLTSAVSTSHVLDLACSADVASCASTMSSFASDLIDDDNCGQDYEDGNPHVTNAYFDMIAYEPIYRTTCLQSPDTSNYCFVDAVTNTSNPADYDVYFLPYGSTIDSSSLPTCSPCLQATLDIFSDWAQVEHQPLADSYLPSATAINDRCGAGFANVNITIGGDDDATSAASPGRILSLPLWVPLTISTIITFLF
ncbi:hypothetical protein BDW62DRAFT_187780 [Aspergillus aurantiobrunneus]